MRVFWVKVIGIIFVGLVLFTYQMQAHNLAVIEKALGEREQGQSGQQIAGEVAGSDDGVADAPLSEHVYKDGTFKGTGRGYSGDLTVEVTVSGGKITDIQIAETEDDKAYLDMASELLDKIKDAQTTDGIDTVSGATYSSKGILEAAAEALSESEG